MPGRGQAITLLSHPCAPMCRGQALRLPLRGMRFHLRTRGCGGGGAVPVVPKDPNPSPSERGAQPPESRADVGKACGVLVGECLPAAEARSLLHPGNTHELRGAGSGGPAAPCSGHCPLVPTAEEASQVSVLSAGRPGDGTVVWVLPGLSSWAMCSCCKSHLRERGRGRAGPGPSREQRHFPRGRVGSHWAKKAVCLLRPPPCSQEAGLADADGSWSGLPEAQSEFCRGEGAGGER